MIRLLEQDKFNAFSEFCKDKITGAVIYTRLKTYGIGSNEAHFWYSEKENGQINAVCSMLDGIFLVCTDAAADNEELRLFSQTVGAYEFSCGDAEYILKFSENKKNYTAEDISGENIKDVFPVIFEDDKNSEDFFARWYTDASHKIRHGYIHGKCICENGKCVSAALTSGETDTLAVISSVATLKSHRKCGYGERVVLSLVQSLNKDVYLMTNNPETKSWYERIGFTAI